MKRFLAFLFVSVLTLTTVLAVVSGSVVTSKYGMVAAANEYAARIGAEILERGGNALDAAIAVSFALGVAEPYASGIGGEGYAIVRLANGERYAVDFKSVAPGLASYDKIEGKLSSINYTAKGACVPGVVAGAAEVWKLGARMPWAELIKPSIDLARNGLVVNETFAGIVSDNYERLLENAPEFLKDGMLAWEPGDVFTNPTLADTLELIAKEGPDAFYKEKIAEDIEKFMLEHDGFMRKSDLENYKAIVREALHGTYRGYDLYVPHPPVSGPQLLAILNILENFNLSAFSWDDPLAVHIIQQVLVLEDVDRRLYISDPAFFDLPTEGFISKEYAKTRLMELNLSKALDPNTYFDHAGNAYEFVEGKTYEEVLLKGAKVSSSDPMDSYEFHSTTHFSVVDRYGNAVAWTQTLSSFFGTSMYVDGFFLNNEIGNFASTYREGDVINLEPGKRPRTTICPTIIEKDGKVKYVLGTPGGGRIISTITQLVVDLIDFGLSPEEAVKAPKFVGYASYKDLRMEKGFPENTVRFLEEVLGHKVKLYEYPDLFFGGPNIVAVEDDGTMIGVGSIRRNGAAACPEK
ncbi:MAG: gamma-glutamyltranspeptidase / glutathione hydrolase [Thermotogota bacterium]|nr:gamma-glutamyltranspeptidase / glutathione hydrolase [Thermotogota bacterium]MDK2864434.1 gamma-glutamyltranspeptidase / glutathione hydrolase [Thermotogota bacterium]HCZ05536.1 gamma-glutamyltransferase [Thermotogota bacterium]